MEGDQTGLIVLFCFMAAFAAWSFFCWWSHRRIRWEKIYDIKSGRTRYHQLPPPDPSFISFPPSGTGL